jgi:hypothetical protein
MSENAAEARTDRVDKYVFVFSLHSPTEFIHMPISPDNAYK